MIERVRNVIKRDAKKLKRPLSEPDTIRAPKKRAKGIELLRRYPTTTNGDIGDPESQQQHMKAIATELTKSKPRDSVLLELMRSTYGPRRLFILNDADSVSTILNVHPALSRPILVRCLNLAYPILHVMLFRLNRKWG